MPHSGFVKETAEKYGGLRTATHSTSKLKDPILILTGGEKDFYRELYGKSVISAPASNLIMSPKIKAFIAVCVFSGIPLYTLFVLK